MHGNETTKKNAREDDKHPERKCLHSGLAVSFKFGHMIGDWGPWKGSITNMAAAPFWVASVGPQVRICECKRTSRGYDS